ncbi:MAG TPA: thiamine pyrophosphate-binding protein [Hyphomicrobiaceae bacterium]|nr:thiamine pyrophosphate-binding protein [Hyphomicrobiaceae bacterium]
MRHGGQILVDQLRINGAKVAFTVPGESFLAALDGLYDAGVQTIICRQEGGCSMMAEAYGKMTGTPGLCFVTRGPGLANAMAGLHVAQQDSTPMILFLGLPALDTEDREAFQEVETKSLLGTFVKWVAVIRDIKRIPEYVSRAYHTALSGRPGPVVIGLPEDMLSAEADVVDAKPAVPIVVRPAPQTMATLADALAKAERPIAIVGGPGWSPEAQRDLEAASERLAFPVASAFRYQDYFDNRHPNYIGCAGIGIDPKLQAAIRSADLLLVIGARMGEMTTQGYTLLDIPNPKQTLVHVHPEPRELGSVYRADMPVVASTAAFVSELQALNAPPKKSRDSWIKGLHDAAVAALKPIPTPGKVQLEAVMHHVSDALPEDAVVTNGAGNYAAFLHRYFTYKQYRTCLAPTSGSMGYGLPAAIAAKIAHPSRTVVNFAGDGCFMMTCQELATCMQYDLPIVTVVVNNGMYGTIRMHQEREYPSRVVGTRLTNPDFAAFAKSFGGHGETVLTTAEFPAALQRALASGKPAIVEVRTDPEAISVRQTITQLREQAQKK